MLSWLVSGYFLFFLYLEQLVGTHILAAHPGGPSVFHQYLGWLLRSFSQFIIFGMHPLASRLGRGCEDTVSVALLYIPAKVKPWSIPKG